MLWRFALLTSLADDKMKALLKRIRSKRQERDQQLDTNIRRGTINHLLETGVGVMLKKELVVQLQSSRMLRRMVHDKMQVLLNRIRSGHQESDQQLEANIRLGTIAIARERPVMNQLLSALRSVATVILSNPMHLFRLANQRL
jgi:hypothetical protein